MMNLAVAAIAVALAPLLQGILQRLRARWSGRPGASLLQPYRELRKLVSKETVVTENVSVLTSIAPGLVLGSSLTALILVPMHDAFAFAITLAFARFVLVLAALDSRSGFEGMAASREMLFAGLSEAPLIAAIGVSAFAHDPGTRICCAAAVAIVMLAETARIPIDNQETHYELTMVHEGLVLEYGGPPLALLHAAAYVRQVAFFSIVASMMPGGVILSAGWFALLILAVPLLERWSAKLRLFEVPSLFTAATVLAAIGAAVRISGGIAW